MTAFRTILFYLTFLAILFAATPIGAQTDASMNALLEQVGLQDKSVDRSPVPASEVKTVNLKVHWRLWKRVYSEGRSGKDELAALVHDGRSVGWINQPELAMAVAALASGEQDATVAHEMFEGAQYLAPDLPYPYLLQAAWGLQNAPAEAGPWLRGMVMGLKAGARWPDTSFPWALKLLAYILIAWAVAFGAFVFGQLLRNFSIAAYDFARVMPAGFSSNQTALVLVAAVAVPGLLAKSALVSLLILLGFVSLVQQKNERIVTLLAFGLVATLPTADRTLATIAAFPGSTTQAIAHAQYINCDAACRENLTALAEQAPDDLTLKYTELLAAYREGSPASLSRVDEEVSSVDWPRSIVGYAHNLQGAARVALAKPKQAVAALDKASAEIKDSPAPRFNLMRAHQMLGDNAAATAALESASARKIRAVTEQLRYERRDVNSFLMVEPLPLALLWSHRFEAALGAEPGPIEPVWRLLAGEKLDLHQHALMLGGLGLLLTLLGFPLRRRTSTPCPRCGLARDPVDAREKTSNHAYCHPCYSTYVAGAMLDYDARVHNEKVLGRRETMQRIGRRLFSLLLPGLGHTMAGWAGTGFLMTFSAALGVAFILHPLGILRPPQELVATNWAGQVTVATVVVGIVVLAALNAALRDIPPIAIDRGDR